MYPPREFLEQWSRENPRQAIAMLIFGGAMICFVVWLIVAG